MVLGLLASIFGGSGESSHRHRISAEGRNACRPFNESWLTMPDMSQAEIDRFCAECTDIGTQLATEKSSLLDLVAMIDLTTLSGDDTPDRVRTLVDRAVNPLGPETWETLVDSHGHLKNMHCAAVCVYPARVLDAGFRLAGHGEHANNIGLASVAGGFPSGQYRLESRLLEIKLAVEDGATEIDTVINRAAGCTDQWTVVYDELRQMRDVCGDLAHLKTILATGELVTNQRIWSASMAAMMAGSDFIKTSTGKETVNATLPVAYVMCTAIRQFYDATGIRVGFKPAGGIKTPAEALAYLTLVQKICGNDWMKPSLFRIGASSLLDVIEKAIESS